MDIKSNHSTPILTDPTPIVFSTGLFLKVPWKNPAVHNWLDAMKSSSPTHQRLTKDDTSANDVAVGYSNWLVKYPSALNSFENIMKYSKGKRIALFLDYDGTLSPIVDNPDLAFMSDDMRDVVKNVAKYIPTAIISGRSRDKVREFVGLQELYYAGSHGMDIMGPGKEGEEGNLFQPASEFLPMINEVYKSLVDITKDIKGAIVENNKFCLSVHYRNVEEKNWQTVAQYVENILKHYPRLRFTHGRKVLEVRPVLKWDKGKAVEFLLDSLGLNNSDDVVPIYVGDDRTDEDAFKFLREFDGGFGILVSCAPKESSAFYSLKDPSEVMEFLKLLVMSKKSSSL